MKSNYERRLEKEYNDFGDRATQLAEMGVEV